MGISWPAYAASTRRAWSRIVLILLPVTALFCADPERFTSPAGGDGNSAPRSGSEEILDPRDPSGVPPPPVAPGRLKVKTTTTGHPDEGPVWVVTVDGALPAPIGPRATVVIRDVPPGDRLVGLSGLPANCVVDGNNPRTITVVSTLAAQTTFMVDCGTSAPDPVR